MVVLPPSSPSAAGRLRVVAVPLPRSAGFLPPIALADGESVITVLVATGTPGKWDASTAQHISPSIPLPSSASPRVALLFVASHTRQQVKRAAVDAEGYVLDPFSRQAVATHLHAVGDLLVKAFGATPPYAVFSDSLEAYGADWTPALPEEFLKRRGYDLLPHLAELVAGGSAAAEQVRHDYGRTLTELVDENYLAQIEAWAHDRNTKFRSQTYGEPAVSLSSQRLVDLPEGEGPQWRQFSTLRWATSANHLFGNNVASGESFTWLHSPVFRATPLDMKAEADLDFIMGENLLIYHGWPYSPPQAGEPGWSLYAAAVFNDHNPWHPVMPYVNGYVARLSYLLRQGEPANQVALLLPTDDAWAHFSPGHVSVSGAMAKLVSPDLMSAILSTGYNVDFVDADAINRLGVREPILVLPPTYRMPIETLRKINAWVKAGGKVIAVGDAPSLDSDGTSSPEFQTLSRSVFNAAALVSDNDALVEKLQRVSEPDLHLLRAEQATMKQVGFIRRKLSDGDIYFVANTSNQPVRCGARLSSTFKNVTRWDPETGVVSAYDEPRQGTDGSIALDLAPYESAVYVFTDQPARPHAEALGESELLDISRDWNVTFTSLQRVVSEASLADWTSDSETLHYSGEAVYTREITLKALPKGRMYLQIGGGSALMEAPVARPDQVSLGDDGLPNAKITLPGPGMRALFDPPLHEAALVVINGREAGALWHPPYKLEISSLLTAGTNHIVIRVYNTAVNAWAALPPHDYAPLIAKYGDRFQMQDMDKIAPVASGILGTVHLVEEGGK